MRSANVAAVNHGTTAIHVESAPAYTTPAPSRRWITFERFVRAAVTDTITDKMISTGVGVVAPPAVRFGARALGVQVAKEFADAVVPGVMAAVALGHSISTWRDHDASRAEKMLAGVNLLAGAIAVVPEGGLPAAALGAAATATEDFIKARRQSASAPP